MKMMTVAAAMREAIRASSSRSRMRNNMMCKHGAGHTVVPPVPLPVCELLGAGGLVDGLDQLLADAARHFLMHRLEGGNPRGALFGCEFVELGLA